jgi:hypothetical protein
MSRLATLWIAACVMAISSSASAKNPGQSATDCVAVSRGGSDNSEIKFTNQCGTKIFVVWCGELKYSKKQCGDGPTSAGAAGKSAGFFTHSSNVEPDKATSAHVKGSYRYAACKGGISFGNDGEYTDDASGGIKCLKR